MDIKFISTATRSDTSIPFFNGDRGLPASSHIESEIQSLISSGVVTRTIEISTDELARTSTVTCGTVDSFNQYYNLISDIALGKEFLENSSIGANYQVERKLEGIDTTFKITTTYFFNSGTDVAFITDFLSSSPIESLEVLSDSIVAVHAFQTLEEFSAGNWNDYTIAPELITKNITKQSALTINS